MHARSLVVFTVLSQIAVGIVWILEIFSAWNIRLPAGWGTGVWVWVGGLMGLAILASFAHLGNPINAWRMLSNLRSSWLSREILCAALFMLAAGACAVLYGSRAEAGWLALSTGLAGLLGLALLWSMGSLYRLSAAPAWNTWLTPLSFVVGAGLLGGSAGGILMVLAPAVSQPLLAPVWAGVLAAVGLKLLLTLAWFSRLPAQPVRAGWLLGLYLGQVGLLALASAGQGFARAGVNPALLIGMVFGLALVAEMLGRIWFYTWRLVPVRVPGTALEPGIRHGS